MAAWIEGYERLASRHRDADGRPPQHTWFYRAEYRNPECIRRLSESAFRGYGEIEFHLHHGHDDHESFRQKLVDGLDWFGRHGAMVTAEADPRSMFAYIAGNWSLDNGSGEDAYSGCNTELRALREAGWSVRDGSSFRTRAGDGRHGIRATASRITASEAEAFAAAVAAVLPRSENQ